MPVIAPWLRPADVLGAMSAGGSLGLQRRAANQRDAEMAQRMQLAQMEAAQQEASAAERLRYNYDSLMQARELALKDDEYRKAHDAQVIEQNAAKLLQDKSEADALSKYREGQLKIGSERNDIQKNKGTAFTQKFHNVGGVPVVETAPGVLELANIPGFAGKAEIPLVKDVPLDPKKPYGVKLNMRANDPMLNQLMGTNAAAALLGTNYAPMPKLVTPPVAKAPAAAAPEPAPVPAPAPSKKMTAAEKAAKANAIAAANPNLSREEIIQMLQDE